MQERSMPQPCVRWPFNLPTITSLPTITDRSSLLENRYPPLVLPACIPIQHSQNEKDLNYRQTQVLYTHYTKQIGYYYCNQEFTAATATATAKVSKTATQNKKNYRRGSGTTPPTALPFIIGTQPTFFPVSLTKDKPSSRVRSTPLWVKRFTTRTLSPGWIILPWGIRNTRRQRHRRRGSKRMGGRQDVAGVRVENSYFNGQGWRQGEIGGCIV